MVSLIILDFLNTREDRKVKLEELVINHTHLRRVGNFLLLREQAAHGVRKLLIPIPYARDFRHQVCSWKVFYWPFREGAGHELLVQKLTGFHRCSYPNSRHFSWIVQSIVQRTNFVDLLGSCFRLDKA